MSSPNAVVTADVERLILVVDDDVDVRSTVSDALEDAGWLVVGAANGREALELLEKGDRRPRLVLLDLMMPVMDGWSFRAAQLERPEIADIPVLVFSAYNVTPDTLAPLRPAGYLQKPFDLHALISAIERVAAHQT